MVNLVTIDGWKYMVDVAFGINGPTRPLRLEHGREEAGIAPGRMRLVYDNIPDHTDRSQRLWIYQNRQTPETEWTSTYAFTELEFLPQDYEIMNLWTSTSRKTFFTYRICVVKFLLDGSGEVEGTVSLVGAEVKRRIKRGSVVLQTCRDEVERIAVLEELFAIKLTKEERGGIRGLCTELKGDRP